MARLHRSEDRSAGRLRLPPSPCRRLRLAGRQRRLRL